MRDESLRHRETLRDGSASPSPRPPNEPRLCYHPKGPTSTTARPDEPSNRQSAPAASALAHWFGTLFWAPSRGVAGKRPEHRQVRRSQGSDSGKKLVPRARISARAQGPPRPLGALKIGVPDKIRARGAFLRPNPNLERRIWNAAPRATPVAGVRGLPATPPIGASRETPRS